MAVQNQSTWDDLHSVDNSSEGHDDANRSGCTDSCGVEESLLTDKGSQHSERDEKRAGCSPAPPAPSPNSILDMPTLSTDLRRRGRIKRMAENVSNMHTRQSAYLTQMAPKWPLPLLPAPSNRSLDPVGGSWMIKVHCNKIRRTERPETRGRTYRIAGIPMQLLQLLTNSSNRFIHPVRGLWMTRIMRIGCSEVRSTSKSETRGHTHRTAGIYMQLPQALSNPSKRLWNIANTYWRKGVPPGSTRNDAKWPRNLRTAKRLPRSSGTRRDNEYRAEWPNHSPAPPKWPPNDLTYAPSILRDSH
ncbi:hypothetical protein F5141DRAFT_1065640 [Pisolithus sp. B1]|nr:hypothetical protein F5141DRAFT_1065640 [Pisolithus sp. B1]